MIVALSLPVLVGMAGLAIDAGMWAVAKRQAQGAADQAAYSVAAGSDVSGNPAMEARAVAASMGFADGVNGVTVTVANPPSQGSYAGKSNAWEVSISQPQPQWFSGMFLSRPPSITARAVATRIASGCVLALDSSAAKAVQFDNNASLTTSNCAIYSNSSASSAIYCANNCTIDSPTYAVGGHVVGNNGSLNGSPNVTGAAAVEDPYASVDPGGILVQNNATLSLASGVYYVDQQFGIQNNAILNANPPGGVTIIINGTYCIGTGSCQIGSGLGNNATINITAQSSGPFAGIAMMGPRNSSPSVVQEISNNSVLNIQGALYFPSQTLHIRNNAQFNPSLCNQVIGSIVHFENNATLGTNCRGAGIATIGLKAKMVE